MLGTEYSWLATLALSFRRLRVGRTTSGVITVAVAGFCLGCLSITALTSRNLASSTLTASAPVTLPTSASAEAEWPEVAIRIGLLLPQLLPRDR